MNTVIPIFLSSDDNYAPFIGTTIISICRTTESLCSFYILDGGISENNKDKLLSIQNDYYFNLEFITINNFEIFHDIDVKRNLSLAAFSRLLIPYLSNLKKIIYLDVDLIVLDDIKKMYSIDMQNKTLAAVPEFFRIDYYENLCINLKLSPSHKYFNSGILLIDCERWRERYSFNDILDIEKEYRDKIVHNDQDILNICFENDYLELPYQYNYNLACGFCFQPHNIIIRHFNGLKPSKLHEGTVSSLMPYCESFWEIAKSSPFYEDFLKESYSEQQTQQLLKQLQLLKLQYTNNFRIK